MPPSKLTDDELLERISEVFRTYGYEGASIRLLSDATGLERASLYHRYPGGKEEMAQAVIAQTCDWFEQHVFAPLREDGPPANKLRHVAAALREFYRRGALWCVMDAMTLGGGPEGLRRSVQSAYRAWLDSFAALAREGGATPAAARAKAEQALIGIEGALVIARVTADQKPFLKTVEQLQHVLLD